MKQVQIKNITISNSLPFTLIAGPCAIETLDHAQFMCGSIKEICSELNIPFIYKSSFDKANRSSFKSERGIGIDQGLNILSQIRNVFDVPVLTDIHDHLQPKLVSEYVDVLQIPAFLSRQTDLLIAAAEAAKEKNIAVNIKKGQFLAPWDMKNVVNKINDITENILLTERGASFGYNTLVSDMRSIKIMSEYEYPIIYDATHSVQQPGGMGDKSGGQREFVSTLARAAAAVGVAGIFMEVHQDPDNAPSDGPNMIRLDNLKEILYQLKEIDSLIKKWA